MYCSFRSFSVLLAYFWSGILEPGICSFASLEVVVDLGGLGHSYEAVLASSTYMTTFLEYFSVNLPVI